VIVDRFGASCVVQLGTGGMERLKEAIQAALIEVLTATVRCSRNDGRTRANGGLGEVTGGGREGISTACTG